MSQTFVTLSRALVEGESVTLHNDTDSLSGDPEAVLPEEVLATRVNFEHKYVGSAWDGWTVTVDGAGLSTQLTAVLVTAKTDEADSASPSGLPMVAGPNGSVVITIDTVPTTGIYRLAFLDSGDSVLSVGIDLFRP